MEKEKTRGRMTDEFNQFWSEFPAKVGKLAAQKEYEKARKQATAEQILEGVRKYRQHKPAWQQWAHARTWLHQGRWLDEYDVPPTPTQTELPDWYAEAYAKAVAREQARTRVN